MHKSGIILAPLLMLVACGSGVIKSRGEMMNGASSHPPTRYGIPFAGSGQLATIWSSGPVGSHADTLVITDREGSQRVMVGRLDRVRWRTPAELIVEEDVRSLQGPFGTRIVRTDRSGRVLDVLSDGVGLGASAPSPDGRWLALQRVGGNGVLGVEMHTLDAGFAVVTTYHHSRTFRPLFPAMAWRPDATQLVTTTMVAGPGQGGILWPRLVLLDRDTQGIRRLPDGPGDTDREQGVSPLFWTDGGIYARANRGLLRCDPQGAGCALAYDPGTGRAVLTGTSTGSGHALLLVQDLQDPRVDPLEVRAKEIHLVDLTTGKGTVLLRAPPGVFFNDIDWIADGAAGALRR